MRWKGFLFIGITVLIVFLLSLVFTDQWLENRLEELGTAAVGAQVDIDDLDLDLSSMSISLGRLQITDAKNTMKNVVETSTIGTDLEFWPLLSGKVIVNSVEITGVRTNTDRETDGKVETTFAESSTKVFDGAISSLRSEADELLMPQLDGLKKDINVDSIMSAIDLQSIKKIDSLKQKMTVLYETWDKRLKELDVEGETKTIESEINKIDLDKLDDPVKLQKSLTAANNVKNSVDKLSGTFEAAKKDLFTEYKKTSGDIKNVNDWIKEDYAAAMKMAKLPDFSVENIGKLLFGGEIVNRFTEYLGYIGMARDNMGSSGESEPKEVKPPRLEGQDIYFYKRGANPDWWVKSVILDGVTETQISLRGNISNLVSDQRQIDQVTSFNAEGKDKDEAAIEMAGSFNYLEEVPKENFNIAYSGFSLANQKLADSPYLPGKVAQGFGTANTTLELEGDKIDGLIKFNASKLGFASTENKAQDKYAAMLQNTFDQIKDVDMKARVFGSVSDIQFDINSNIDKRIKDALQGTLNKEIDKAKKQLTDRIDKEVAKYREDLEATTKKYEKDLRAQVKKYEDDINKELKVVEDKKKEIQKAIDKQTGDVQKQLKDIFKF